MDVLTRIDVDGTNVTKVVITHMHWDHVGGMEMFPKAFPKATFYVQKKEYEFWIKHPVARRSFMRTFVDDIGNRSLTALEGTPGQPYGPGRRAAHTGVGSFGRLNRPRVATSRRTGALRQRGEVVRAFVVRIAAAQEAPTK